MSPQNTLFPLLCLWNGTWLLPSSPLFGFAVSLDWGDLSSFIRTFISIFLFPLGFGRFCILLFFIVGFFCCCCCFDVPKSSLLPWWGRGALVCHFHLVWLQFIEHWWLPKERFQPQAPHGADMTTAPIGISSAPCNQNLFFLPSQSRCFQELLFHHLSFQHPCLRLLPEGGTLQSCNLTISSPLSVEKK